MIFEAFFDERPIPKARARVTKGRGVTPARTRDFEATLVYWMREEAKRCGWTITSDDLCVSIRLHFDGKAPGDVDNYAKAITDAANGVLMRDDRQIARLCVERFAGGQEGFWLRVTERAAAREEKKA